jgi:hypothetical protein
LHAPCRRRKRGMSIFDDAEDLTPGDALRGSQSTPATKERFAVLKTKRRGDAWYDGMWCRECKAHTHIVHCHLLFHLPVEYRTGARFLQTEAALFRLVGRHDGGILGEFAVKLTIHSDLDGLYLLKGGDREVWDHFDIRKAWRKSQGIVHGKRCGTTENIGLAQRARWRQSEQGVA